jgi:hypothetical protein
MFKIKKIEEITITYIDTDADTNTDTNMDTNMDTDSYEEIKTPNIVKIPEVIQPIENKDITIKTIKKSSKSKKTSNNKKTTTNRHKPKKTKIIVDKNIFNHNKVEYEKYYEEKLLLITNSKLRKCAKCWLKEAIEIYGYQYKYNIHEYKKRKKPITVVCNNGHSYKQTPSAHTAESRHGCKACAGKIAYTNVTFVEAVAAANPNFLELYSYHTLEEPFPGMGEDIKIWCNTCLSIFTMCANNHLNGENKCGNCHQIKKDTHEDFLAKSRNTHGDLYEYPEEYKGSQDDIRILHKECGKEFMQRPSMHIFGNGCSHCYGIYAYTFAEFKEILINYWGDWYDYSEITSYKNNRQKFNVKCNTCDKIFETTLKSHINKGRGCKFCKPANFSKCALDWLEYCEKKDNIRIIHAGNAGEYRIPNTSYKADGYCAETNTVYEFHGDHWHGNPITKDPHKINQNVRKTFGELYDATIKKEQIIREQGYNYISMWENQWRIHCNKELVEKGTDLYVCTLCGVFPYKTKANYDKHLITKHPDEYLEIQMVNNITIENEQEIDSSLSDEKKITIGGSQEIDSSLSDEKKIVVDDNIIETKNTKTHKSTAKRSPPKKTTTPKHKPKNDVLTKKPVRGKRVATGKKFKCPAEKCDVEYSTVGRLNIHINDAHKDSNIKPVEKTYPCPYCSEIYYSNNGMKYHIKHIHKNELNK